MDWQATVHKVAKRQTGLKRLSMHTRMGSPLYGYDPQSFPASGSYPISSHQVAKLLEFQL